MNKNNHFLNTSGLLSTLFVLALCFWARRDLPGYITPVNYMGLFALAATIFILPDFLCHYFPSANRWYRTSEFYTVILILSLGVIGIVLSKFSAWIGYIILPIGMALASWQLFQFVRDKNFLTLPAVLIFLIFEILLFYSLDTHSFLFPEKIILGKAYMDILFHSSMGNMFSTLGWPSTGLDGSPYIPYHWGSHALMAGLKNWTGLNMLMFYNIAYPVIYFPLFFKSLLNFLDRLCIYKGFRPINILVAISILAFIFSLPVAGFQFAMPMDSESFGVAFVFTFLFASNLLSFIADPGGNRNLFFLYTMIMLILISFLKLSNGFICTVGMCFIFLRVNWNFTSILKVLAGGIIIAAFTYLFFIQTAVTRTITLSNHIYKFWGVSSGFSMGFINYLAGAFLAIIIIMRNNSLKNRDEIKLMIRSKQYIDLETLMIITLAGFFAGMYVSSHAPDVYYFCSIQLFITIPFLILYAQNKFGQFRASEMVKNVFLYLVILLSVVARPDITLAFDGIKRDRREVTGLTKNQQVLQAFIADLFRLEKESNRRSKCIYIPRTETWYYGSQSFRPVGSPMVATAISGVAMVGGAPVNILNSYVSHAYGYGYRYYKINGQLLAGDVEKAKKIAALRGYSELIEYKVIDGKLNKQLFDLRNYKE